MPPRAPRNQRNLHPYITFPTNDQNAPYRAKLERFLTKNVAEGRRIDWGALSQVGLDGQLRDLFQTPPYERIFNQTEPVYRELVLEFFSTFSLTLTHTRFRLGGRFRTLDMRDFGIACGIWTQEEEEEYEGSTKEFSEDHAEQWRVVSLDPLVPYDPQNTKASGMPHILKYLHMILSHTITARGNSHGNVTTVDLFILSNLYSHLTLDLGRVVARQAREFSNTVRKSTLGMGSIITRIARYFNIPEQTEPALTMITESPPVITIETMLNMRMVRKEGGRYYLHPPRREPENIPPPDQNPPNEPVPPQALPPPERPPMTVEERLEELRLLILQTQASVEQIRQYLVNYGINPEYADLFRTPPPPPNP